MKNRIFLAILLLLTLKIFAQGESFGLTSSNYSGVNSVLLNPSAMHNQNTWLSYNLISANLFFHTDFAYLDKNDFRIRDLFNPDYVLPSHYTGYIDDFPHYSFNHDRNTSIDISNRIIGPSLMISYNQHAFAITSATRFQTNVRNLTPDLANILAYGFHFTPQWGKKYEVKDLNGTTMAWSEIGFSYAYRIDKESFDSWSFGVSIKRLLGAGGAYMQVDKTTYGLFDAETIGVANQQAEIGFSVPLDYDNNEFIDYNILNGRGWSMDLGFTYQALIKNQPKLNAESFCEQPIIAYKYRIGVALMDIGSINYKQNAQTHNLSKGDEQIAETEVILGNNVNDVMTELSNLFYNNPTSSLISNTMRIALPMALSAQFDYNTEFSNLYWNASLIYGLPLKGGALRRPNQLTITPRYESSQFELGVPLSMYQFRYPHLGLYARIGVLTVGSDWLSTLLGTENFHGIDIYFALRFQLRKDNCRPKKTFRDACN